MNLIERLEAASEGSRKLDAMIGSAVGAVPKVKPVYRRGHYIGNKPVKLRDKEVWAPYTMFLDVAMTLVPTHNLGPWPWCVLYPAYKLEGRIGGMGTFKYMDGKSYAGVRNPLMSHMRYDYEGYGTTPPLALCIAALKAYFTTPQSLK